MTSICLLFAFNRAGETALSLLVSADDEPGEVCFGVGVDRGVGVEPRDPASCWSDVNSADAARDERLAASRCSDAGVLAGWEVTQKKTPRRGCATLAKAAYPCALHEWQPSVH